MYYGYYRAIGMMGNVKSSLLKMIDILVQMPEFFFGKKMDNLTFANGLYDRFKYLPEPKNSCGDREPSAAAEKFPVKGRFKIPLHRGKPGKAWMICHTGKHHVENMAVVCYTDKTFFPQGPEVPAVVNSV